MFGDDALCHIGFERSHAVVEGPESFEDIGWDKIGPRRDGLAKLDESRTQLFAHPSQALT